MDERCVECPWFDREKDVCCRKSPRFCEVDAVLSGSRDPAPDTRAA